VKQIMTSRKLLHMCVCVYMCGCGGGGRKDNVGFYPVTVGTSVSINLRAWPPHHDTQ